MTLPLGQQVFLVSLPPPAALATFLSSLSVFARSAVMILSRVRSLSLIDIWIGSIPSARTLTVAGVSGVFRPYDA